MSKSVRLYHDYASPFSYLATTQIEGVCADRRAELIWHPMLLGAVFKQVQMENVPLLAMSPAKQRHYRQDIARYARYYGVPFAFPSRFPMRTVDALRLTLAVQAGSDDDAVRLTHRIYRAYWVEDRDIADRTVLAALLKELELAAEDALDQLDDPAIKQALFDNTAQAVEAGHHGWQCPTPCERNR